MSHPNLRLAESVILAAHILGMRWREDRALGWIAVVPPSFATTACEPRTDEGWSNCACELCHEAAEKPHKAFAKHYLPRTTPLDRGLTVEDVLVAGITRRDEQERAALLGIVATGDVSMWRSGRSTPSGADPAPVRRSLTPVQRAEASAFAARQKLRKSYDREDVVGAFWCELLGPSGIVARKRRSFKKELETAWGRALRLVRSERSREIPQDPCGEFDSDYEDVSR